MIILGINAYHGDSSCCILKDGKLIAAAEEERFRRLKHWAGFPSKAIGYCLYEAGVKLLDVDHIAINQNPRANLYKKISYSIINQPDAKFIIDRIANQYKRSKIRIELKTAFPEDFFYGKVHHVEHHLAHMASSFYVSSYEKSIVISVDGFGDFSSTAVGVGVGNEISIDKKIFFPHSLGIFYNALTQFLGFPHYGDEYKVMGLAPYGTNKYIGELREILKTQVDGSFELNLEFFQHHENKLDYTWSGGVPILGTLFKTENLEKLLGFSVRKKSDSLQQHHFDLAHSIQAMYEKAFFNILNASYEKYNIEQLALAGGCAMNSVANGKIYRNTPFKQVYVQPAAGDAGGAIGAAFQVANELNDIKERFIMDHAYWGPSFSNQYHEKLLSEKKIELELKGCLIEFIEDDDELCKRTAQAISEGLVIGWFQERMEWGPRALGNRSILCDPRREDIKDILNLKIKRRESFRPFAPSILREKVSEWFDEDDDVPFMMKVFQIQKEKRKKIPAVTHVDGSGRLQTVSSSTNFRYHKLISSFFDLTGVPILLNTSFNENEPVVCSPKEALDTFLRSKMDLLVLDNWLVDRTKTQP